MGKTILKVISGVATVLFIMSACVEQKKEGTQRKKIFLRWSGYGYPVYDKFRSSESKKFEIEHP